jgi:hypothetical protein
MVARRVTWTVEASTRVVQEELPLRMAVRRVLIKSLRVPLELRMV